MLDADMKKKISYHKLNSMITKCPQFEGNAFTRYQRYNICHLVDFHISGSYYFICSLLGQRVQNISITLKLIFPLSYFSSFSFFSSVPFSSRMFWADPRTPIPARSPIPVQAVRKKEPSILSGKELEGFGIFLRFDVFASSFNLALLFVSLNP